MARVSVDHGPLNPHDAAAMMPHTLADELILMVDEAGARLRALDEATAAAKPAPGIWSVKEIVGHLIDSAANNHHRFVRAQETSDLSFPAYDQDAWVRVQDHQGRPWLELVDFWTRYNDHLAHAMRRIPGEKLEAPCRIGTGESVTLGFLLEDYLVHLRHHLKQIQERSRSGH